MKISWTPTARASYFNILDYLEEAWTEREIQNFISEVDKLLDQIAKNPELFQSSRKRKMLEKASSRSTILSITG